MKGIEAIRWSNLTKREKTLVVLTAGSLLYALIAFFYYPQRSQWKRLHTQKSSLEQEVSALSSALPAMEAARGAQSGPPSPASLPFPVADSALSAILEEINQTARMKEVQVMELRPGALEKRERYDVLPIQMRARSRFRNLDEYILALERLPQPMGVEHIKIESTAQTSPDVTAEMTLLIYKKGTP